MPRGYDAEGNVIDTVTGQVLFKSSRPPAAQTIKATEVKDSGAFKDVAKGIAKNLPSSIIRGVGGLAVPDLFAKAGTTAGAAAASAINKLRKPDTTKPSANVKAFTDALYNSGGLRIPGTDVDIVQSPSAFKSFREAAGLLGEGVFDVGSTLLTGGSASVAKNVGKGIAKETAVKTFAKNLLNPKRIAIDVATGGGGAAAVTAQDKNATASDIVKSGLIGGAFGLLAPPALGALTDVTTRSAGALSKGVGKALKKTEEVLTDYATPKAKGAEGTNYLGKLLVEPQTKLQKTAEVVASGVSKVREAPYRIKVGINRFTPAGRVKDLIEDVGGIPLDADFEDNFQSAGYRAGGEASEKLKDYIAMRSQYGSDFDNVKRYSMLLDYADRAKTGITEFPGGLKAQEIPLAIKELEQSLTPEQMAKVKSGQQELNKIFSAELDEAVNAGIVTPDDAVKYRTDHPNYIPHSVVDFIAEKAGGNAPEGMGKGPLKGFNITNSGIKRAKGSQREIEDIDLVVTRKFLENRTRINNNAATRDLIAAAEKAQAENGVDLGFRRITPSETIKEVDYKKQNLDKISFFRDGVKEERLVPKDVGEMIKYEPALSGPIMGTVVALLSVPARVTRALATTFNPMFALVSNPLRDIQTSQVTSSVKARDLIKGLGTALGLGKNSEELYSLANKSGALQSTLYREFGSPERVFEKMMKDADKSRVGRVVGEIINPFKLVETMGGKMEEMTRIAVFSRAIQDGLTPQQAAKAARDATVDFGKYGHLTEVMNKLTPFFNARIQGAVNLAQAANKDPYRFSRKLLYTSIYPTTLLLRHNSQYEAYDNVPDSDKRKFWVIMYGQIPGRDFSGNRVMIPLYTKIPKGEAQQAVSSLVNRMLTIGMQKEPETTAEFIKNVIGDFSPVDSSSLMPAALKIPYELIANKSLYRDAPIEPDYIPVPGTKSKYEKRENVKPYLRATKNTLEASKELGKLLGWSPAKIDYVIRVGVMNDLLMATDRLQAPEKYSGKYSTPEENMANMPFIRSVLGASAYGPVQKEKEKKTEKEQERTEKLFLRKLQQPPR